jgi:hypothetical protein
MNDEEEYLNDTEPHLLEADELLDSYDGASIDAWATVDISRLIELLDIELQQRAPSLQDEGEWE